MKKLLSMLLALALVAGSMSTIEARCGRRCAPKTCAPKACNRCYVKPSPCAAPCVTERSWLVQEPCRKMICVEGVCDHKVTEKCVTTQSKKCVSPCRINCSAAVNPADRGEGLESAEGTLDYAPGAAAGE